MNIEESMQREKLRTASISKTAQKVKRISAQELSRNVISASRERKDWLKEYVKSKEFILADIPLSSVANLEIFRNERLNLHASLDENPIVVEVNKNNRGRTRHYTPRVIIIHGAGKHHVDRMKGKSTIKAWVGAEATKLLRLEADHQFGAQELQDKLSEILRERLVPKKKNGNSSVDVGPYPWIVEVYPFESYFIYRFQGKLYKQGFTFDDKKRSVSFDGDSEEVIQKYVDLDATMTPMEKAIRMTPPIGNQPKSLNGNMYNTTAPGTGVGPRVQMKPVSKSELGGKL